LNYHHGDLKNTLIKAAISLIAEKGPNAISLRAVAKRAGVSHSAPYRHFKDKGALLMAIAESGFNALATRTREASQAFPDDPTRQLQAASIAYVELAVENPEITQLMFGGFITPDECSGTLAEASERAFNSLLSLIESGKAAAVFRDEPTEELALAAWSMMHGLAMLIIGGQLQTREGDQCGPQQISRSIGRFLMEGILGKNISFSDPGHE
jgi:AcrR family transcriptional regulator